MQKAWIVECSFNTLTKHNEIRNEAKNAHVAWCANSKTER